MVFGPVEKLLGDQKNSKLTPRKLAEATVERRIIFARDRTCAIAVVP